MSPVRSKTLVLLAIALTIACALGLAIAHAGPVTWELPSQETEAESGAPAVAVTFRFRNTSDVAVTFGTIAPSCGCTVGELSRQTWQPGETGELVAHFQVGQIEGRRSVTLHVAYAEPAAENDVLAFSVDVRPWIELKPRLLWWRQGDAAHAKEFTVSFAPAFTGSTVEIVGDTPPGFRVADERRDDGVVTFSIAPIAPDTVRSQQLHLRLVRPDGRTLERTVFLRVM